jgi:hypothetical protein
MQMRNRPMGKKQKELQQRGRRQKLQILLDTAVVFLDGRVWGQAAAGLRTR